MCNKEKEDGQENPHDQNWTVCKGQKKRMCRTVLRHNT